MGRFDGGVYYSDGSTCRRGLHIKNSYVNTPSPSQTVDTEITLSGKAIFGGMLKNEHFGHFLGESLCRLWAAEQLDQSFDTIVFYPRLIGGGLPGYARDLFRLLAPSREIVILERPTKVDLLAVPDQMADAEVGFVYGHQFVRQQMKRLSSLPARTSKKLYISRSKLNTEGSILGEHEIERRLQDE